MRYLGLDLGTKTLGISISDTSGTVASSYDVIKYENEDYRNLLKPLNEIIETKNIETIVLGFPKNMNNTIGPRANKVLEFKDFIEKELKIPVVLEDERLTTKVAIDILIKADLSRKKRKQVVDKLAANVILQSYLDRKKGC
jgi:putative Holliday junction resolvase